MPEALSTDADLHRTPTVEDVRRLQFSTVLYYLHETNPDNSLVRDKSEPDAPASIAAIGMALATIPVIVERGVVIREFATKITRRRLRYLWSFRRDRSRMPPATKAFSIISWTSKQVAASGSASYRRSTRRFCSPVR
jgi:hypothetical protein